MFVDFVLILVATLNTQLFIVETWPPEVLTAREMEPYIIDRLRKIMEKAVTRAAKETEEELNVVSEEHLTD